VSAVTQGASTAEALGAGGSVSRRRIPPADRRPADAVRAALAHHRETNPISGPYATMGVDAVHETRGEPNIPIMHDPEDQPCARSGMLAALYGAPGGVRHARMQACERKDS